MVRVLMYHHFASQAVFSTSHEPLCILTASGQLFAATAQCNIEVYSLQHKTCPCTHTFPTVAPVRQIAYSQKDNYVATLEDQASKAKGRGSVRVYRNWQMGVSEQPMRARVAGHMTSIRYDDVEERFEVIEIPLKGEPQCICADARAGNLAIGLGNTVLVYGFCVKTVADTQRQYKDMKCLLELTFSFQVRELAVCEEYMAVSSRTVMQVVKTNLSDIMPDPTDARINLSGVTPQSVDNKNSMTVVTPGSADVTNYPREVTSRSADVKTSISNVSPHPANIKTDQSVVNLGGADIITHPSDMMSRPAAGKSNLSENHQHNMKPEVKGDSEEEYVSEHRDSNSCGECMIRNSSESNFQVYNTLFGFRSRSAYTPSPTPKHRGMEGGMDTQEGYMVEDEHHLEWSFQDNVEMITSRPDKRGRFGRQAVHTDTTQAQLFPVITSKTIVLRSMAHLLSGKKCQREAYTERGEIFGPTESAAACPVTVEYEGYCTSDADRKGYLESGMTTLVYRRFESTTLPPHSLQLIPVYMMDLTGSGEEECGTCYCSQYRNCLVGMCCYISTPEEGFLYKVYGKPCLLTNYTYTAPCKQVEVSGCHVYAITEVGLEVYTARCLATALHEMGPFDNISSGGKSFKTLPPADLESCLIGLRPFIGLQSISLEPNSAVLLSKQAGNTWGDEPSWSVYMLEMPSFKDLYQDMVELARQHEHNNPLTYSHLLLEAYLMLCSLQFQVSSEDCSIANLRAECSGLLGEYYSRCDTNDSHLALPFYLASGLPVRHVLQRAVQLSKQRSKGSFPGYGAGLFYYMDFILFQSEDTLDLSESEGDLVLQIYSQAEPHLLSSVILRSKLLNYNNEKALLLLQNWMTKSKPERHKTSRKQLDILALAVLYLRLCEPHEAETTLFSLNKEDLVQVFLEYHELLHIGFTQFTHIAQLMRKHKPRVFLQILLNLHDQGTFTLDSIIILLKGDIQEMYECAHVREFLEMFLADKSRQYVFREAARFLVDIYLQRLKKWTANLNQPFPVSNITDIIPKGNGHFGKRFCWLDDMLPLKGSKLLLKPCPFLPGQTSITSRSRSLASSPVNITSSLGTQSSTRVSRSTASSPVTIQSSVGSLGPHADTVSANRCERNSCPCACCNADLLKLQSLMCSKFTTQELTRQIERALTPEGNVHGRDSLSLLCLARLQPVAAVDMLVDHFPEILPAFTAEMLGTDYQLWSHTIQSMVNMLQQHEVTPMEPSHYTTFMKAFKGCLGVMCEVLNPEDFLNLLPADGSSWFFIPYIERSYRKHQANQLKQIIIQRATELEKNM